MKCTDAVVTNYNTDAESLVYWLHVSSKNEKQGIHILIYDEKVTFIKCV